MRIVRYLAAGLVFFVAAQQALSQYAPLHWSQDGIRIRQGYHIEWQRSGEQDQDGNVVYTWSDTRLGDRDVYAQKVSPDGVKLWGDDGKLIIAKPGRQEDPSLIPTGFGDYIFIWNDFRNDAALGDLYAQKIDANGNPVWDPDGVLLSTGDFDSPAVLRIVSDGSGGAIVIWDDLRNGDTGDIYAIRVLSDGSIPSEWVPNGTPVRVADAGQTEITVDTDGAGGAIVAWMDNQATQTTKRDIYAQRVTINGTLAWVAAGVPVCQADNDQESPKLCPDGSGGAYIVWEDKRSDLSGDLYFQRITNDGSPVFPEANGKPLIAYERKQIDPRIVADGSGQAIIIWLDTRNDPQGVSKDIYTQKVNSAGDLLWGATGYAVCAETSNQDMARINADGSGGAVVAWMDERNGNETPKNNIFAQKINASGTAAWTPDGVPVCEATGYQFFPLVRAFANYSVIAWGDERNGSPGIYYQKLDVSGSPQLTQDGDVLIWGIDGNADHIKLVNNGQGKTFVFYQDLRDGLAGYAAFVQILDTLGNTYLETDGRRICPDPEYTDEKAQEWISSCRDGDDGAIAVWEDGRDSNPDGTQIYAQHIGSDGALLWGDSGLQVSPYNNEQDQPLIVEDGAGGGIVAWSEYNMFYIYRVSAARINSDGSVPWTIQVVDNPSDDKLQDVAPDGEGGAYICYQTMAVYPDYNLYAQRVDASGNLLWPAGGIAVCTAPGIQINCKIAGMGTDGAVFVWEDQRAAATGDTIRATDLYAQRISTNGDILWDENGITITEAANEQNFPNLSRDELGDVFVVWQDLRNPANNADLYAQKLSLDGQKLFPDTGLVFCGASKDQTLPLLVDDGSGGNYILWSDFRVIGDTDIYGTHLDADGQLSTETVPGWGSQWVEDGNIICDAPNKQNNHAALSDYSNGVVAVWEDKRSSGKEEVVNVYAQRLNGYVVGIRSGGPGKINPSEFILYEPYPNPFNPDVKVRFDLEQPGIIRLAVYDVLGREIQILKEGWQRAGSAELVWRAENVASGCYIVRMEMGNRKAQQKLLLLK